MSNIRLLRRRQTEIFSIFGQIEEVVAEAMIAQYRLHKIDPKDIPLSAAYDEHDHVAKFAVVMPAQHIIEFNLRCAELRA